MYEVLSEQGLKEEIADTRKELVGKEKELAGVRAGEKYNPLCKDGWERLLTSEIADLRLQLMNQQGELQKRQADAIKALVETLTQVAEFSTLKKGAKLFNRFSYSVDYISTFDRIEKVDGKNHLFYYNAFGELFSSELEYVWYYYPAQNSKEAVDYSCGREENLCY